MSDQQRVDKWLWATRVFKTRSLAAEACKKGRVSIGGRVLKPSALISIGNKIDVRKPPITLSFKVVGLTNNRVGAKLVDNFLQNVTPNSEYEQLELQRIAGNIGRQKGMGRPTKKERRDLEQFIADKSSYDWFLDDDSFSDEDDDWDQFWDE